MLIVIGSCLSVLHGMSGCGLLMLLLHAVDGELVYKFKLVRVGQIFEILHLTEFNLFPWCGLKLTSNMPI